MAKQADKGTPRPLHDRREVDELEQLSTALESALEHNARLVEDRDRLLTRVNTLAEELRAVHTAQRGAALAPPPPPPDADKEQQEERMRVAFEELQVLTEELEVANTMLQQANEELDGRIEERTEELRRTNASLRVTEASLRTITDLVPNLLWRAAADGNIDWFNRRWFEYTGADEYDVGTDAWIGALHPLDRQEAEDAWRHAREAGHPYECEHRIRDARGQYRWFLVRAEPTHDEANRIAAWYATGTDIHDQREAMTAAQRSELRFRTLIEGMPQLVWRAVDGGKWTWASPQWSDYTGQESSASHIMRWLDMVHPQDRDEAVDAWAEAQLSGLLEFEGRLFHAVESRYRHFRTRALPVRDPDGRLVEWLGTSTDVDDMIELQAHQSVLVGELQHRTRNLLAVIQAVVKRTARDSGSIATFRKCFEDRLMALARVQGLLSNRDPGARITFDRLLRGELAAHVALDGAGNGERVWTDGPNGVPLRSATVQTLALALHELITNALKYGALSQEDGSLRVSWQVIASSDSEDRLAIDWRESGVVDLPKSGSIPRGGGYGRELIEKALPHQLGASTTYAFEPDGVHCTIEVKVPPAKPLMEKIHD